MKRRRSACTCTSRSARRAATTARSPRGPTARTSIGDYLDALRHRDPRARSTPGWRRRRACSSAAARRRSSRPTAWPRVLRAIPLAAGAEVTVECNPDDVTPALLETYAAAGVNRVSIGVQSMVPHVLAALGRTHDPANVERAVAAVRAVGLPTFNLDIIYGAAGETLADWRHDARADAGARPAARLGVRADRRGRHAARRRPGAAPRRRRAGRRVRARRRPADAPPGSPTTRCRTGPGPGHECRHNLLYWRQHDYRGFGCAAHSHRAGRRWWNLRTPERYIAAVARGPLDRGRRRVARRRRPPHRGAAAVAAHDGRRARSTPSTATSCPVSSSATATAGCSPAAAA